MNLAVRLESVSKSFSRGSRPVQAISRVTLDVPRGRMTVLTGPSGSGKTTLLNLIGGLERPDSGRLIRPGTEFRGGSEASLSRYRRFGVGYVFQQSNLISDLTAEENIELPLRLNKVGRPARKKRIAVLMTRLGIAGLNSAFPEELSGGERQRVALARAVAHRPELLLADEPTANLDSVNAREVIELIRAINLEENSTVIVATHDRQICSIADYQVELLDGSVKRSFCRGSEQAGPAIRP